MIRLVAVVLFGVSVLNPCVAFAEPEPDQETARFADFLLNGMKEQRTRLRRGVVRCSGQVSIKLHSEAFEGPLKLLCAFDFDSDRFRFDREQPLRTVNAYYGEPKIEQHRESYYRVPGKIVRYEGEGSAVNVYNESEPPNPRSKFRLSAFDIRAVGLLLNMTHLNEEPVEEHLDKTFKQPPSEVSNEGDGVYRVEWLLAAGKHKRTLWINVAQGFTPIRFEVQDSRIKGPQPFVEGRAEWTEIEGVWVPTNFLFQQNGDHASKFEHTFDWEFVNQDVPMSFFSPEGLGGRKGAVILNHVGDEITVERIGDVDQGSLEEQAAELFKYRGEFANRMDFAKTTAQSEFLRILVVLGDIKSETTHKFVDLRKKDINLGCRVVHYIMMPIGVDDLATVAALDKALELDVSKLSTPALIVLDEQGKLIATQGAVIENKDLVAEADKLTKFLEEHAPSYPDTEELLAEALKRAEREDKNVFLQATSSFCGPCVKLSQYVERHRALFDANYIDLKIDGRFKNAEQVIRRLRSDPGGFPWVAVLDSKANKLGTSDGLNGNYGFPNDSTSIDLFMQMLAKTAPRLSAEQLAELRRDLEAKSQVEAAK